MLYPVLPVFLTQTLNASGSIVGLAERFAQATQNYRAGLFPLQFIDEKLAEQMIDSFLRIRAIGRTPGAVMCRGSNMSCHADQATRAREHLQDEGARADKRSTGPRGRDLACINAPRQSALLRRSAHTVPLQL